MPLPKRPPFTGYAHPAPRFRRGQGQRYVPDVVERVRLLVVGTAYSHAEIAARCSISKTTVSNWIHQRGWERPAEAPLPKRMMAITRTGLGPRLAAAAARLAALATQLAAQLAACDPAVRARALEVARKAQNLAAQIGLIEDRDRPRLRQPPPRRRDLARGPRLVHEARDLVENSALRHSDIARRLGLSVTTLVEWAQIGGWSRPLDAPNRFGGQARGGRRRLRNEQRSEGRHRLGEAERMIAGLESGVASTQSGENGGSAVPAAGNVARAAASPSAEGRMGLAEACERAFALLQGAVAIVQRRVRCADDPR